MSRDIVLNDKKHITFSIITVSDTRDITTDKSGKTIQELVSATHHPIGFYTIAKDEKADILQAVDHAINKSDVVLCTGGTGISKRDITIETISPLFEKEIVGFGEIFRMLSYTEDIGSAAILSRATAGVYRDKAIFVMPGSTGAVRLAMEKLILPEIHHIFHELNK